ncbi:hypothetical protein GCM10027275_55430 [Rhabdobacter roseus]|uniref:Uncharacterized protein n=1 Tax=Rhabdobacter roseus TaxID=1655419 RepID=A0A840TT33_9BACT|nr:hypothetical protein [Rhabdobacter roseus]MBB5287556.1 hypothetical protein [Rhabdobacter roseus]
MALPDSLKKAIIQLPPKEKDKLLLRLVVKDKVLTDRLLFELIEESATVDDRREAIRRTIARVADMTHNSPGWIMMDMRSLSGDIAYHVKVTKDKYGEIDLNLFMLNAFFAQQADQLRHHTSRSDKCALYMAKKAQTILNRLTKLDTDYYVDFESGVNQLLQQLHTMCTQSYARQLQLPKAWP